MTETIQITADPVTAPALCTGWNDGHDCRRPADHPGDHRCAGCHDVWNRGPWDDDADEWEWQRPEDRCIDDPDLAPTTAGFPLPALSGGRQWEVTRWKSSPRKRTPDRIAVNLYARTGAHIGYIAEYDNGWGINVAKGNGFKSLPGVFTTGEGAAAALLKAIAR